MIGLPLTTMLAAVLAGCAAQPQPPTYRYAGIELSGATRGKLFRTGECVVLGSGEGILVPIWPGGTRITSEGVRLPQTNGGALLRFGDVAYLYGGHLGELTEADFRSLPDARGADKCADRAFLVNRAESHRALEARAPQPPHTSGLLVRRGDCLILENVEGVLLPIWPPGTQVTQRTVVTPNLVGHAPLLIGGRAGMDGRYVYADDGSLQRAAGADSPRCASRGMLVEKANRVYFPDNAVDYAAMSDAVLVVEMLGADSSDPLADGFLTTITARVVEPLTGSFTVGEIVRLRHIAGQDVAGHWRVATHDPLYAPFGHFRLKAGQQLLLFVNRDFYRQQAEARGGEPLPNYLGGAGIYRIVDGKIVNDSGLPMPETVEDLRRLLTQ